MRHQHAHVSKNVRTLTHVPRVAFTMLPWQQGVATLALYILSTVSAELCSYQYKGFCCFGRWRRDTRY